MEFLLKKLIFLMISQIFHNEIKKILFLKKKIEIISFLTYFRNIPQIYC